MGRVWRAADEILDRQVAVKEMRIDGLDAEDTRTRRERTLREARATARIDHPNVVRVYDVVDEGERLWIVMELVAGRSLEQIMAEEGPLGPRETARLGLELVEALSQVHARGVLHRDIKPGNVLVENGGRRVVLTDFGIAAIQDAKALTMVGMLVGSPDYMAPERVSGRPQGPPSDVWSLGATLCAALAGRSPFSRGTTLATLHAVLYEEPELPATAGPLRDILAALLEKEPSFRPGLEDLESSLRQVVEVEVEVEVEVDVEGREAPVDSPEPPQRRPEPSTPAASRGAASLVRAVAEAETQRRPAPAPLPAPPGELPAPAPPRRAALVTAVGLVTAGAVVAIVLAATSGSPDTTTAGPSRSPSSSQPPSSTASPTVEGTSRPPSLPPGTHEEAGGFAWATPQGWRRDVKTGAEVHYTSPDAKQELAAKSSLARGDLMETWQTSEQNARKGQNYRKIRLEETTFRDCPAVVWEYTFTLKGVPWHARLLGFNTSGKSYQINTWYQPEIEAQALKTYGKVKDSFTVRD